MIVIGSYCALGHLLLPETAFKNPSNRIIFISSENYRKPTENKNRESIILLKNVTLT